MEFTDPQVASTLTSRLNAVVKVYTFYYATHIEMGKDCAKDTGYLLLEDIPVLRPPAMACAQCIAPFQVHPDLHGPIPQVPGYCIDTMTDAKKRLVLYNNHRHRALKKEHRIVVVMDQVRSGYAGKSCIVIIDYKTKIETKLGQHFM